MSLSEAEEAQRVAKIKQSKMDIDTDTGTGSSSTRSTTTWGDGLRVAFWNIRNFSEDIIKRRAFYETSEVFGKVGFIYDYVNRHKLDFLFLAESGEIDLEEVFGSQFKTQDGQKYYIAKTDITGDENYILIYKSYHNWSIANFNICGQDIEIQKTSKSKGAHKMKARKGAVLQGFIDDISIDFGVIHTPSPSWDLKSRKNVLDDFIGSVIKKGSDTTSRVVFGDFNFQSKDIKVLNTLFRKFGFTHAGPFDESDDPQLTSLKALKTIRGKTSFSSIDDVLSQPYDQAWFKSKTLHVRSFIDLELWSSISSVNVEGINTKDYIQSFTNCVGSVDPLKKRNKVIDGIMGDLSKVDMKTRVGKILGGTFLVNREEKKLFTNSKKKIKSYTRIQFTDLAQTLISEIILNFNLCKPEEVIMYKFFELLSDGIGKYGENFKSIPYTKLFVELDKLKKYCDLIKTGSKNEHFFAAYHYLVSDHLPINFEIDFADTVDSKKQKGYISKSSRAKRKRHSWNDNYKILSGERSTRTKSNSSDFGGS